MACRRASFRFNPLGTEGRVRSNQAHELAHVLLDHKVRTIERVGDLKFLTCDVEHEEEADGLGGCLLLPRELLLKAAFKGMSAQAISDKYRRASRWRDSASMRAGSWCRLGAPKQQGPGGRLFGESTGMMDGRIQQSECLKLITPKRRHRVDQCGMVYADNTERL